MTEAQWLAGEALNAMIGCLRNRFGDRLSERKHRLFNVACCRRVWGLYRKPAVREAILTGERYADGAATPDELRAALRTIHKERSVASYDQSLAHALQAAGFTAAQLSPAWPFSVINDALFARVYQAPEAERDAVRLRETRAYCALLRDFFGNPFRPAPALDPARLRANDGIVLKLAQAIYDERAFDRLPILADALEEAGCDSGDILTHCRCGGEHARGCWAVDLLLGRQ